MAHDPNAALYEDPDVRLIDALAESLRTEQEKLATLARAAADLQWSRSAILRPREDAGVRADGEHSDPTADAAGDARRVALRAGMARAINQLQENVATTRYARSVLEYAVARWSGEEVR